jgi:hypothetical protein
MMIRGSVALAVIACDKRKAFAQGSKATKQSSPFLPRDKAGLLRFARNDGKIGNRPQVIML